MMLTIRVVILVLAIYWFSWSIADHYYYPIQVNKMLKGATSVAAVAAIGNLLQGWDGGAIAGMIGHYMFIMKHFLEAMNGFNSFWEECQCFQEIYS